VPYFQFFIMVYCCSYSQFFGSHGAYFIALVGFYLTYVTAILNLNSTADMPFDWFFYEPFVFAGLVYCDANRLIGSGTVAAGYILFFAWTITRYLWFMTSVIRQLTKFLEINFLTVGGKGAHSVSDNLMGRGSKPKHK
jgi:hypothetical protein